MTSTDDIHENAAPWPYRNLDLAQLRNSGWHPHPFREFVLKVQQNCNLVCDYCYVYTKADRSWRERPAAMSAAVVDATAERIAEHSERHELSQVRIILHGGEPLLGGSRWIVETVQRIRAAMPAGSAALVVVQTNGTCLGEESIRRVVENSILVGVSLDGNAMQHDRHRRFRNGRGSFAAIDRNLRLLSQPEHAGGFAGILATMDPTTSPVECYEALQEYRPRSLDFLFPHANWSSRPVVPGRSDHPFGDWLVSVFDRWYDAPTQEVEIHLFEQIIAAVLGRPSNSECVGLSPAVVVTVETDGAIEQADALKSAYSGAPDTGLSVLRNSFDDAMWHPGIVARQIGTLALSPTCLDCQLHALCGGGQYAHRYREGEGFQNPSVYCRDLARIITHIRCRVLSDISGLRRGTGPGCGPTSMTLTSPTPRGVTWAAAPGASSSTSVPQTR